MDLTQLPPGIQTRLLKLGISRPFDLVLHLPLRYEDETQLYPLADAPIGTPVLVEAEVLSAETTFRPKKQFVARVGDGNSTLVVRLINFYPNQVKQLAVGKRVRLYGEIRHGYWGDEMVHPKVKNVGEESSLNEALTPVYSTVAGLAQAPLTKLIARALNQCQLDDTLPAAMLNDLGLPAFADSVRFLHNPTPDVARIQLTERLHPAWRRVKFDELLAQQLSLRMARAVRRERNAPRIAPPGRLAAQLVACLPFGLTKAQNRVLLDISKDLAQRHPMQRLLQGDVGSGKTIVSAIAACHAIEAGYQVAMLAPTEILAEQHYRKFLQWLEPLGIQVRWLTGSLKAREKREALATAADGTAQIVCGTHAIFQQTVEFKNLGLSIVDEQHRFGVAQRLALREKGGSPHQLMMSATPIPRTLAMSFYADLDVSVIDELPPGRTPIVTKLVSDARRDEIIERIASKVREGRQVYWVCPLIEESEALQLQTAVDTHAQLTEELEGIAVGLLHGKMKPADKAAIMADFLANKLQVLVATTVIEVGVDVPNASLMVIEHAERMGLSQLHQLRGRVGRGAHASLCILLYSGPLGETAKERLKVIYENTDGFVIAKEDLRIRGPGELAGVRQSGVPLLRFADLENDADLLDAAREAAEQMLTGGAAAAEVHLQRWLPGREALLRV
ncbi:ATP-dependent DNA helicase RecG [Andreprevotia lacus DSM 23236]|jgi:ATP-dependent DNA helicase RecG|uniref:ATP-dependent DNA helicase RecG n=1 Tax=Andreprevotia lacus DSM 23236 TaxID=1121001 RepID=A0A1W1WWC3_9NEIS|nr:ATP-dependent DNA helicase RecG [Andreprevotia lacus]SMC16012.1 ATP-dependent DNA helicase RecG [Andreprevotia lacus DSM 23236]